MKPMKPMILAAVMAALATPVFANAEARQIVNELRSENGVRAIAYSPRLERAAQRHATDMARGNFFSHTGRNGSSVGDRARAAGYKWCYVAENIAQGQTSLTSAMNAWVNSRGHRRNIMNRKAREFAVAKAPGNFWVMVLAKPC